MHTVLDDSGKEGLATTVPSTNTSECAVSVCFSLSYASMRSAALSDTQSSSDVLESRTVDTERRAHVQSASRMRNIMHFYTFVLT